MYLTVAAEGLLFHKGTPGAARLCVFQQFLAFGAQNALRRLSVISSAVQMDHLFHRFLLFFPFSFQILRFHFPEFPSF